VVSARRRAAVAPVKPAPTTSHPARLVLMFAVTTIVLSQQRHVQTDLLCDR
jgi:hypothetical protein